MLIEVASIYAVFSIFLSAVATLVCIAFAVYFPENLTLTAFMYAALWFAFSVILLWGIQDKSYFSVLAYVCFLVITNLLFIVALFMTEFESSTTALIGAIIRISLLVPELLLSLGVLNRFQRELNYSFLSVE